MTGNAIASTQADCGWTTGEHLENWVYKTFGLYSRTNNTDNSRTLTASKIQGTTTYVQGIFPRNTDGLSYFQHVYTTTGGVAGGVVAYIAVADSLGLFMSSREHNLLLRCFKRNVQITYNNTVSSPGLGTGGGGAIMLITGTRNLAFIFSTKHNAFLSYTESVLFADMVQRYQVGLARAV